jgi:general secretion pathway protein L
MKTERILRLYLQGNWSSLENSCAWALLKGDLGVIKRGISNASGWPPADEYEAVVTADQVSWLSISLPEKLGRDADKIIAYALEDKLLEPPEAMHIVIPRSADRAQKSAIAIRRTRLREIIDAFSASGKRLDRLYTEMQLAPSGAKKWTVCRFGETAFLRLGADLGLAIDWPGTLPPDALTLAIARARTAGDLPEELLVAVPAKMVPDLGAWSSALGVPVTAGKSFDPLLASTAGASNLLAGPFAPSSGKTGFAGRSLRLSAIVLLLAAVGHTLLSLADWAWLAHKTGTLRTEATALYRDAVPDSKAPLLNPSLQLQSEASAALRERGRLGSSDMLTMLAMLSSELPPKVQARRIQFDRSGLEIITVLPENSVQSINSALRLRGYAMDATALRKDATGTEYKIRMYLR